ncbi:MAG: DNA-directed RNA polymerase subunit H [Candidatus Woesearchaeota archaeon]
MATKKTLEKMNIAHVLVPKHELLSQSDAKKVLDSYGITVTELPKLKHDDPAIKDLGAKAGDIVRITRESMSSGESVFYRTVIGE